jgi:single-strand DNA-binding protein
MNTVILRGNLGNAPVVKTSKGTTFANFNLALNHRPGRDREPYTDWFRIVAFGKLAETLAKVGKGDEVLVTGSLHRTSYTKDGTEYRDVEIRARDVEFLRRAQRNTAAPHPAGAPEEIPPTEDAAADDAEPLADLDGFAPALEAEPPADLAHDDTTVPAETQPQTRRPRR